MDAQPSLLDLDTVQAFIRVTQFGSFTKAADDLHTTQAAISLKIKRLESKLGCRVLVRTPRKLQLTQRGEIFLPAARELLAAHDKAFARLAPIPTRRLRLGMSDHVSGPGLPALLGRLAERDPSLLVELKIASSADLIKNYDAGEYDAIVVRRDRGRRDATLLAEDQLGWYASRDWRWRGGPLRIASVADPCEVRTAALNSLDAAAISWMEIFVGGGATAVGAAISAGLGVAALARRSAPADTIEVGSLHGLPALPLSRVILITRLTGSRDCAALRDVSDYVRGLSLGPSDQVILATSLPPCENYSLDACAASD